MRNKPVILIWAMVFVLLAGSMKNALVLNFYLLDNSDFIEFFCENKDKPQMHCNGNCQLSKIADRQDEKKDFPVIVQLTNELVFYSEKFEFEFPEQLIQTTHTFWYLSKLYTVDLEKHFPPPLFA